MSGPVRCLAAQPGHSRRGPSGALAAAVALSLVTLSSLGIVSPPLAVAAGSVFYAYAGGQVASPTSSTGCPETTTPADQCTLAGALSLAGGGDIVYLATPGAGGHYVGNWSVNPTGTSASAPLTIEPAPGVADPTLDGNGGSATGCQTSSCSGSVLTIGAVFVDLEGTTVEDGNNTTKLDAGGISNNSGGTLSITSSIFSGNTAGYDGGAIDNGDGGTGTLSVTSSTFSGNTAGNDGGAIDNGDNGGSGTASVTSSTFEGNQAAAIDGGAIDNGDNGGSGTASVSTSTFSGTGVTYDGGAIDNGDFGGNGTLNVTSSTFSANAAGHDGGTIDNGDNQSRSGTVWVAADIFNGSCDQRTGTWHDQGYNVGSGNTCLSSPAATGDAAAGSSGLLGPLDDNGGPTETMLPLAGNPALGLVPENTSVVLDGTTTQLCPTTDQRGVGSVAGAACNAGSVQYVLPVAPALSFQTDEGTALFDPAGTLQAGVSDANGGATSWTAALSAGPAHGTLTLNADGSFTYTPASGFVGADSLTYTVADNLGYTSAPATVAIAVVPVFSITVDGGASATTPYGTTASFADSGVPPGAAGTLSFSTAPGGLPLCTLSFPTAATSCSGPGDLAPGQYTVTASFADSASGVSTPATATAALDVSTVPVVASVSGSQAYGSAAATLTYTDNAPAGVGVAGTLSCPSVDGGEPIGAALTASSYTVDGPACSGLTLTGTASANYALTYVGLSDGFVVSAAPLTVTASSAGFTYGGTVPAITPSYAGFVGGDSPASLTTPPTCSTTATSTSPPGTYPATCTGAAGAGYAISYVAGTVTVTRLVPVPSTTAPGTPAPAPATASPGADFPGAGLTHPNGAVVHFGAKAYVLAGGHAFLATAAQLGALGRVDHARAQAAPAGAPAPTEAPRPGTLLSTKAVGGTGTVYVAGTDGELHGFSTPHQFFADGYNAALVVTVPSLAGLPVGATAGVAGAAATALSTRADGALVDSAGTFYVFAGGRAFGLASPAALGRVRAADPAEVLTGRVGAADRLAGVASGALLSAPGKVYVSYQGALYLFKGPAQLAAAGYAGTAAVAVPGTGGLSAVG